jgi:predicted amidohydrolase YtcJ
MKSFGKLSIVPAVLIFSSTVVAGSYEKADVVYTNGKIYTVNESQPWAEAVAIKDGKFLQVGSNADMETLKGSETEVIDLGGRFVMPGVNDLHHHGMDLSIVSVDPNQFAIPDEKKTSPESIVQAIKEFAVANPELPYIYAEDFPDGMFPGNNGPKEMLDQVDTDRAVIVLSSGGHAHWANSKALELAGINAETDDPEYGVINRKPDTNEPSGGLHESAMQLMLNLTKKPTSNVIKEGFKHHTARINSLGITAVRIAGIMQDHLDGALELDQAGELNAYHNLAFHWRTSYIARHESDLEVIKNQIIQSKNSKSENVSSASLKYYADGAPASKTAYLLEDYENDPGNKGILQMDENLFQEEFAFWTENGITTMTHVVGDAGARSVVDAIESAQKAHGKNGVRHHITHTVMMHPDDIGRLNAMDVVVDVSPAVAAPMSFHSAYKHHYGTRHEEFFPARQLIDAGARFMVSSDFPVGPDNPWVNMEVWTTRMNPFGEEEGTLGAHSAITLKEAIRAATMGGAYGLYLENELGSIESGKRATFIILNQNLFDIPSADLSEIKVEKTVFNGRVVYELSN